MARKTNEQWEARREAELQQLAADEAATEIWRVSTDTPPGEAAKYATGIDVGYGTERSGEDRFHTLAVEVVTAFQGEGPYPLGQQRLRRIVAALMAVRGISTEDLERAAAASEDQMRFRYVMGAANRALGNLRDEG